jgi:thiol:disulfide interchange protein DsbD
VPRGFTIGQIRWPQPVRLGSGSIVDYGYEGSVLLITRLAASSSAAAAVPGISADVKYIVCREVCVPGNTHLTLVFPPTQNAAERHALFEQARQALPKPAPTAWKVVAQSGHGSFTLSVGTGSHVQSATFFPLVPGQIENSARQDFVSTSEGFRLTLRKSDQLMKPIAVLKGLVVLGPGRAFEVAAPVSSRQGQRE